MRIFWFYFHVVFCSKHFIRALIHRHNNKIEVIRLGKKNGNCKTLLYNYNDLEFLKYNNKMSLEYICPMIWAW